MLTQYNFVTRMYILLTGVLVTGLIMVIISRNIYPSEELRENGTTMIFASCVFIVALVILNTNAEHTDDIGTVLVPVIPLLVLRIIKAYRYTRFSR